MNFLQNFEIEMHGDTYVNEKKTTRILKNISHGDCSTYQCILPS